MYKLYKCHCIIFVYVPVYSSEIKMNLTSSLQTVHILASLLTLRNRSVSISRYRNPTLNLEIRHRFILLWILYTYGSITSLLLISLYKDAL